MNETDFALIRPVKITDAILTASNVPEPATGDSPDPAAWNPATAYAAGDRVSRFAIHKIFQRVVAGTTSTAPELDFVNWLEVGSTNRFRMFDDANESQTTRAENIQVTLTPGTLVDSAAFLNIDGDSIRVVIENTAYDRTVSLRDRTTVDWYAYFFEPFVVKTEVVFRDFPLLANNVVNFTLTKAGGIAKMGVAILGLSKNIGSTELGARIGIIDYSTKNTSIFGNTTVIKRAFSRRMEVDIFMDAAQVDEVQRLLSDLRSTPIVWIGAGNAYGALIIYGFYRNFDIVITYFNNSKCRLEIEGLT
jgi:hypothetical protein